MGVKIAWLTKITREARSEGKMPALAVSFVDQQGKPIMDGEWALIPMSKFKELASS